MSAPVDLVAEALEAAKRGEPVYGYVNAEGGPRVEERWPGQEGYPVVCRCHDCTGPDFIEQADLTCPYCGAPRSEIETLT